MAQVGNKINSWLNGQWAKHVSGKWWKRFTSKRRRAKNKQEVYKLRKE